MRRCRCGFLLVVGRRKSFQVEEGGISSRYRSEGGRLLSLGGEGGEEKEEDKEDEEEEEGMESDGDG